MDGTTLALTSLLLVASQADPAAAPTTEIKVSQIGYPTRAPKLALVSAAAPAKTFVVRRAADAAAAYQGRLSDPLEDKDSGDRVQTADLTALTQDGLYVLEVPGVGRSVEFAIGGDVFSRPLYLAMRSFYGQRCGMAVDLGPEYPSYRYPACHQGGAYHASSGKTGPRASAGGWHDAGDYGRYIVNSGITTGTLLWAFELFRPRLERLKLDIPESGDAVPDFIDEIRWNLDWMLSLQDADGGVWHKQTSESFIGFAMPQDDKLTSYVVGTGQEPFKSSCGTADFAAVMAIATRVYRPYDAAYADRALGAARRAWGWAVAHPAVPFHNPPGVRTGGYGDASCGDELLWAAAELWRTTGDETAHRYFLDQQAGLRPALKADDPPAWPNVAPLAFWAYLLAPKGDATVQAGIRNETLAAADAIVERTAANGYRVSLTTRQYGWGSNGIVANYALQLLIANWLSPKPGYVDAARDNVYYLLGRNTFSLSWLTRVGANAFRKPHHRPSAADANELPWPGLLSGGPNRSRQDEVMRRLPEGLPPAKMYVDDEASYATNENAINWNAALVFALAGLHEAPLSADEPARSWVDPDTGHRVVRLSDEPGSASLYFHQNAYTPDGRRMAYTAPSGISVLDLATRASKPLVAAPARIVMVGHRTGSIYYLKDGSVYAADIESGATREIGKLPPRGSIATVNADETLLAGTYLEGESQETASPASRQLQALEQPRNKEQMMEERLAARRPMALFTMDTRTGALRTILRSTDWLNHLQFSPSDPSLLMLCHEGPWHKVDRIWTIRADGSQLTRIHERTMKMEIAGHEFWGADGRTIWYDLQTPRGEVFWLAGHDVASGERTWHHLERDFWSIHFNVSRDGRLFCGDGGDEGQVARAKDGKWIYLFRPERLENRGGDDKGWVNPGVLRAERLVNMAEHDYRLEPNVTFTPDAKWVVFRSNMLGPTHVFAVEVARDPS